MLNRFLYRITANRPVKLINLERRPYLERYFIGQLFDVTFYLHRYVSGDAERHLHNHPWTWGRSLVLCGGYVEDIAIDLMPLNVEGGAVTHTRRVYWWNKVNGNSFHRVTHVRPGTWTLFFHGPMADAAGRPATRGRGAVMLKGWGFLENQQITGGTTVTLFRTHRSTRDARHPWWKTAALGRDSDRQNFVKY